MVGTDKAGKHELTETFRDLSALFLKTEVGFNLCTKVLTNRTSIIVIRYALDSSPRLMG